MPARPRLIRVASVFHLWLRIFARPLSHQITEDSMAFATAAPEDIAQLWLDFKAGPTEDMRNRLVEQYLPLVKYNGERIWARLPEGVELDDLISAGVFGLMDAIDAFDLS